MRHCLGSFHRGRETESECPCGLSAVLTASGPEPRFMLCGSRTRALTAPGRSPAWALAPVLPVLLLVSVRLMKPVALSGMRPRPVCAQLWVSAQPGSCFAGFAAGKMFARRAGPVSAGAAEPDVRGVLRAPECGSGLAGLGGGAWGLLRPGSSLRLEDSSRQWRTNRSGGRTPRPSGERKGRWRG